MLSGRQAVPGSGPCYGPQLRNISIPREHDRTQTIRPCVDLASYTCGSGAELKFKNCQLTEVPERWLLFNAQKPPKFLGRRRW